MSIIDNNTQKIVIQFSRNASAKINEAIRLISKPPLKRQDFLSAMQLPIEFVYDKQFDEKIMHNWLSFCPMKLWYGLCYNGLDTVLTSGNVVYAEILPVLKEILDIFMNETVNAKMYLDWFLSITLVNEPQYDISTQNMIKLFQICQKWLNDNATLIDCNVSLLLPKNTICIEQNDFDSATTLLLLKIIIATCNIFNTYISFSIKAFIFVPNVVHLVLSCTNEMLVLEITSEEINIITQNIEIFESLFYYKITTPEIESISWQKGKQTYETIENKIWSVDTHILPLNHNLLSNNSTTHIISVNEIINAVVRSRLRAERQLGIILGNYKVELIDSTKSNLWFAISEYFFWWFCNVQGIEKDLQVKQSMNDSFAKWIVIVSHMVFVGDWAKSHPLLRSIKITFYTGPEKIILDQIYDNVLLPLGDKHHSQYSVNGIYSHGFIKADAIYNWTKIHQNIILFMELAHIHPEVMMWLLNTNIKLNKNFVKSIHPLFSEGTLKILHIKYNADIFLSFVTKLFLNADHQGWIHVHKYIKDCYPIQNL